MPFPMVPWRHLGTLGSFWVPFRLDVRAVLVGLTPPTEVNKRMLRNQKGPFAPLCSWVCNEIRDTTTCPDGGRTHWAKSIFFLAWLDTSIWVFQVKEIQPYR